MNAYEWALAFKQDAAEASKNIDKYITKNTRSMVLWGGLTLLAFIRCLTATHAHGWNSGTKRDGEVVCNSIDEHIDWETA